MKNKTKILFVTGDFTPDDGRKSELGEQAALHLGKRPDVRVHLSNGGSISDLEARLRIAKDYDIVFWWPNVPNDQEKIRNVKLVNPHCMLISCKRNDGEKYSFMELTQRTLAAKADLTFEFRKGTDNFHVRVFDPLGCVWYEGNDILEAMDHACDRLFFLKSIIRQDMLPDPDTDHGALPLRWYFDRLCEECMFYNECDSSEKGSCPNNPENDLEIQAFMEQVRTHAETFTRLMNPAEEVRSRFLGTASLKFSSQVGRCSKDVSRLRPENYVFISRQNVDRQFLTLDDFVPCRINQINQKLYYTGAYKPSVDAPVQLKLYGALPQIRFMLHSHCYLEDPDFTTEICLPCGALDEVGEILHGIDTCLGRNRSIYKINLKGHGSLIMAETAEAFKDLNYTRRPMPERMF